MIIIYLGNFVEPSQEYFINNIAHAKRVISIDSFQKMFLAGVEQCGSKFNYIINAPDIGAFPKLCKRILIPGSEFNYVGIEGSNISFLNVPYFKKYSIVRNLKKALNSYIKNIDGKDTIIIVVSTLYYHMIKPALDVKKKYPKIQICAIVYDLPDMLCGQQSLPLRIASRLLSKIDYEYESAKYIDAFVVLSPYMMDRLNSKCPYMVMEGIYNDKLINNISIKKSPKTLLYTGSLDSRYGTDELVDAFRMIADLDFQLWICGDGAGRAHIEEVAKIDNRIKYFGIVDQHKVFFMQKQASLLINPRKASKDYTKYSFPSKTMEYMASGTPTMMYKLPALPKEYCPYLILLPDESLETFSKYMYEWGRKDPSELAAFGNKAKKFILENKTAKIQATRFFTFLKEIF